MNIKRKRCQNWRTLIICCRSTLGENIADNGGLKAAYRACFPNHTRTTPPQQPVPGLRLTAEQLFFVSYAQVWCGDNTAEYEVNKLLTNPHPPSSTRVTATLSNSEEFSRAFQCPPGAVMNPDKKCSLW